MARFHIWSKRKKICIILASILVLAILAGICIYFRYQHTSPRRRPDRYDGAVAEIICQTDADGDGVPDQQDILSGALAYIETRPAYKSAYYAGGYPDDGYGVCTDVVAFALRSAGYDLMELVDADIAANPQDYAIEVPEPILISVGCGTYRCILHIRQRPLPRRSRI